MSDRPIETPRSELAEQARRHYDKLATEAWSWNSVIERAIDAWEREPELRARVARLEAALREIADYQRPDNYKSEYQDGHADGWNNAAIIARAALEAQP